MTWYFTAFVIDFFPSQSTDGGIYRCTTNCMLAYVYQLPTWHSPFPPLWMRGSLIVTCVLYNFVIFLFLQSLNQTNQNVAQGIDVVCIEVVDASYFEHFVYFPFLMFSYETEDFFYFLPKENVDNRILLINRHTSDIILKGINHLRTQSFT